MKKILSFFALLFFAFLLPLVSHAQFAGQAVMKMHTQLWNVYNQMIPLCSSLINVSQAIAGFGTLFYIGYRVWKHIARAEPIDFFPLLRPLVLTLLIGIFPQVLGVINGVLEPTVTSTAKLVDSTNTAVMQLVAQQILTNSTDTAQQPVISPYGEGDERGSADYTNPSATTTGSSSSGGFWSSIGNGLKFLMSGIFNNIKAIFQFLLSILLQILYFAAALCIDTIRTFHLIVLAILGPLAFGFSCYDGLQNSLTHWLARYINIFLWLPIANIFGAILARIQLNILQQNPSDGLFQFAAGSMIYNIFLVIGIVGYFCVPGIANYIIHTHGPNPLAQKVTSLATTAIQVAATGGSGAAVGGAAGGGGAASAASLGGYEGGQAAAKSETNGYNRKQIEG